jgi:hypothetical protein
VVNDFLIFMESPPDIHRKKYKVNKFCPKDKNWIRALVMSMEGVRHHTHPIYSVSTSLALKKKEKETKTNKLKSKLRKLLLKLQR